MTLIVSSSQNRISYGFFPLHCHSPRACKGGERAEAAMISATISPPQSLPPSSLLLHPPPLGSCRLLPLGSKPLSHLSPKSEAVVTPLTWCTKGMTLSVPNHIIRFTYSSKIHCASSTCYSLSGDIYKI